MKTIICEELVHRRYTCTSKWQMFSLGVRYRYLFFNNIKWRLLHVRVPLSKMWRGQISICLTKHPAFLFTKNITWLGNKQFSYLVDATLVAVVNVHTYRPTVNCNTCTCTLHDIQVGQSIHVYEQLHQGISIESDSHIFSPTVLQKLISAFCPQK